MKKKREAEHDKSLPQNGNSLHETVTYKIGVTIYEVSTICGSSELLYNKMETHKSGIHRQKIETVWNFIGEMEQDKDKQTIERQRKSRTA